MIRYVAAMYYTENPDLRWLVGVSHDSPVSEALLSSWWKYYTSDSLAELTEKCAQWTKKSKVVKYYAVRVELEGY